MLIDLDRFLKKNRDLSRFRFSYRASRSVVLNTSGKLGVMLNRCVMHLSAQLLCLPPHIGRLSWNVGLQSNTIHVKIKTNIATHTSIWQCAGGGSVSQVRSHSCQFISIVGEPSRV